MAVININNQPKGRKGKNKEIKPRMKVPVAIKGMIYFRFIVWIKI